MEKKAKAQKVNSPGDRIDYSSSHDNSYCQRIGSEERDELSQTKELLIKLTKNLDKVKREKIAREQKLLKKKESKANKKKVLALFSDIMKQYMVDSDLDEV